jgi:hypothetical protein
VSGIKRAGKMSSPLRERGDGTDERAAMEAMGRDWASERGEADDGGGSEDLRDLGAAAKPNPSEGGGKRDGSVGSWQSRSLAGESDWRGDPQAGGRFAPGKVRGIQRAALHGEACGGESVDRIVGVDGTADSTSGKDRTDASAPGAITPTAPRAASASGADVALGRQPAPMA